MASSESLIEVRLGSADVLAGVALSDAARWNQSVDDWQFIAAEGHAIGYRDAQSQLVASAATLGYGPMSWISMVLVSRDWQHRGLATGLVNRCIDHLQTQGVMPVLDATPAGEAVYRRLGFQAGFEITRWEGELPCARLDPPDAPDCRSADVQDLDAIAALDRAATGADRRFLLKSFLTRHGSRAWLLLDGARRAIGFTVARQGRRAMQIGPLIAQSATQAMALLDAAMVRLAGPVFLDVPARWIALAEALAARGFRRQRSFVRMALADRVPDAIARVDDRLFVVAGPEFG